MSTLSSRALLEDALNCKQMGTEFTGIRIQLFYVTFSSSRQTNLKDLSRCLLLWIVPCSSPEGVRRALEARHDVKILGGGQG